MGLFREENATERVTIGDGWVELRKYTTVGDERYATDAAMGEVTMPARNRRVRREGKKEENAKARFSSGAYEVALLERHIVAWSEKDTPIDAANIERLPSSTRDVLMGKLDEWNPARSEEEDHPLGANWRTPSEPPRDDGSLTPAGLKTSAT